LKIDKIDFSAFVYKMSCLEYSYYLKKNGQSNITLTSKEKEEIESIIYNQLHRVLLSSRRTYMFSSKVKLSKKEKAIYKLLKKYAHIVET